MPDLMFERQPNRKTKAQLAAFGGVISAYLVYLDREVIGTVEQISDGPESSRSKSGPRPYWRVRPLTGDHYRLPQSDTRAEAVRRYLVQQLGVGLGAAEAAVKNAATTTVN